MPPVTFGLGNRRSPEARGPDRCKNGLTGPPPTSDDRAIMLIRRLFEARRLADLDARRVYDVFRASYEEETGAAWGEGKFLSRARGWTFHGDERGFVAVRRQRSGMKKLVGAAGDPRRVAAAMRELAAEGGPVWGAVSERLARASRRYGFVAPHTVVDGPLAIRALMSQVPPKVFGGVVPEVRRDGGLRLAYEDTGEAVKYLIGNKDYFAHVVGLPEARDALARLPGVGTFLRLIGVKPLTDIPAEDPNGAN
jgi:hypothetical protein